MKTMIKSLVVMLRACCLKTNVQSVPALVNYQGRPANSDGSGSVWGMSEATAFPLPELFEMLQSNPYK